MPVNFHIPGALREFTAGHARVPTHSPKTLAEALSALWTIHPGVQDRIATEQGQVREQINIFIGGRDWRDLQSSIGNVPLGRPGTPDEIAKAVLFLASDSYVTGIELSVDGGLAQI